MDGDWHFTMTDIPMIDTPSPNFDERNLPVSMLVLHYTGMPDAASAIHWLASPESKVSAHYVVTEDGQVIRMVDEAKRAWHAGRSHWRGIDDINSASIGIEIVNPGHEWGYRPDALHLLLGPGCRCGTRSLRRRTCRLAST